MGRIHTFYHWCDRVHRRSKLDDNWSSEGSGGYDGQWWEVRPHKLWCHFREFADYYAYYPDIDPECLFINAKIHFWWAREFNAKRKVQ
jgi:hypothetical protein